MNYEKSYFDTYPDFPRYRHINTHIPGQVLGEKSESIVQCKDNHDMSYLWHRHKPI
ncbi:hypothetical protein LEWO105114_11895 [Legionella worsleiensis]|uniref:Uncharacterized protein n=1 Tax=Legionella worsleiensis TaxID=45076 RepID=A0A0W1A332_9GAMM|nr:hypothetical protein Lwor_2340 [Legionella worsleiensis]STY32791.1 Uncharacterised protein [Legionella worsleiensis]